MKDLEIFFCVFIRLLDSFVSYWYDEKMVFNLACGRRIMIMIAFICILKLEVLQNRVHKCLKIRPSILNLKLKVLNEPQGLFGGLGRETGNKIDFQQNSKKKSQQILTGVRKR